MNEVTLITYAPYEPWMDHVETRALIVFPVREEWLEKFVKEEFQEDIKDFLDDYTWDDAELVFEAWKIYLEEREY